MAIIRYDIEAFLTDVKAFLIDNLPAQITAINAEKNDGYSVTTPSPNAYFLQTHNNKANNYDVSIFYGIADVQSAGQGATLRNAYAVYVVFGMSDGGNSDSVPKKLFRYQRVLQDLFNKHWADMGHSVKLKISSLAPVSWRLADSSEEFRACGVMLDFTIAG